MFNSPPPLRAIFYENVVVYKIIYSIFPIGENLLVRWWPHIFSSTLFLNFLFKYKPFVLANPDLSHAFYTKRLQIFALVLITFVTDCLQKDFRLFKYKAICFTLLETQTFVRKNFQRRGGPLMGTLYLISLDVLNLKKT